jgi:hypothetical protein
MILNAYLKVFYLNPLTQNNTPVFTTTPHFVLLPIYLYQKKINYGKYHKKTNSGNYWKSV